MKSSKFIFITVCCLFATGCASKYAVTFDSYPQGATLICDGTNWGYTPRTLYYDKSVKKQKTLNLGSCSANWVSGARKSYGTVSVQQYPNGVKQTQQRPNVPGYSQDAEFALKVEQMKIQKEQSDAANSININPNPVKQCRKFGDLSGQIYQFQGFCPFGYF